MVQKSLLPVSRRLSHFTVADFFKSSDDAGGDWYGYFEDLKQNRAFFCMGDVTGQGVASAVVTGTAAGSVTSAIAALQHQSEKSDLTSAVLVIARAVNSAVYETAARMNKLMTMVFMGIDKQSGEMVLINAGHQNGYLISSYKSKPLLARGSPLGLHPEPQAKPQIHALKPGDLLFFFTDGLIENTNSDGRKLCSRELVKILEMSREPEIIKQELVERLKEILQAQKPGDDFAFMIVRWNGPHA